MFKISFLCLLFSLLLLPYARAQDEEPYPYVPIPTDTAYKWNVMMGSLQFIQTNNVLHPAQWLSGKTCQFQFADSVFHNNMLYHRLINCGFMSAPLYFRQDSLTRRVYCKQGLNNPEGLFYDFGKNVGDTVFVSTIFNSSNSQKNVIDSISYITINGSMRKIVYTHTLTHFSYMDVWIEGIGSLYGIFSPKDGWEVDVAATELQCLTLKGVPIFQNPRFEKCVDTIGTVSRINNEATLNVSIYPNPVIQTLNLNLNLAVPLQIAVYDMNGKKSRFFESTESSPQLNLSDLPSGMYILCIQSHDSNHFFTSKFIKQ